MWFSKPWPSEDEESLLPPSPTTTVQLVPDAIARNFAGEWRQLPRVLLSKLYQLLMFAIPSFVRRPAGHITLSEKIPQPTIISKKYPTEYLDGVRGLASFIVFVFHWTHLHFPHINSGYHHDKNPSLWLLPGIRFLYSGAAMVSVFFVVSGYVLTHRFVQRMHSHEFDSLYSGLTSLTFRRAFRLFLPAFASCVLAYLCASLGLFPIPQDSGGTTFNHGFPALLRYMDLETTPWTWDPYMSGFYNPQLWSIALEFRGSIVVFLMVLGLSRTRTSIRLLVELAVCAHAFGHKRWDMALFIAGMTVAELDVFVHMSRSRTAVMQKKRTKLVLWTVIFAGIFLAGFPRDHALRSLGYAFTKKLWPFTDYRRRFWLSLASIFIVAPMPFLPVVHSFFCIALMRYLGKISFALYLIHGLGNRTVGRWLMDFVWSTIGKEGYWTYTLSYVASSVLYLPIIIWLSDIYWRAFDTPATRLAKWLETKSQSSLSVPESG